MAKMPPTMTTMPVSTVSNDAPVPTIQNAPA